MRTALVIGAAAVATLGVVAGVFLTGLEGGDMLWPLVWVVWAPVGAFILIRRPGNGVGLSMLVTGLLWGCGFLALAVAVSGVPLQLRVWADLASSLLGVVSWLGIVWLLLVFPSGQLEGLLARVTAVGFMVLGLFAMYAFAFSDEPLDGTGYSSPLATEDPGGLTSWLVSHQGFLVVIGLVALAITSVTRRWYRSNGVERHQYRWLLLGAVIFLGTLTAGQFIPDDNSVLLLWLIGGSAIPISVGVAVTRYRLYEIDRIISRTLTYAIVVVLLGGVFALGVVAIPNLFIGPTSAPPLVVAASTLAVAALFNPLRRWVLSWVERRFNRSRYDAERVMNELSLSLRDELDDDAVLAGWQQVVSQTMHPSSLGVWVRL